jgi:multiple sugar transport system ATP-binding protein
MTELATVAFEHASKVYPDGTKAVSDLELTVPDGQLMVLVGPSGCGKTTALRMLAGLESITHGMIRIGERVVNNVPSRDRDIAMVFQSYALYPHLSVYENIAFGLRVKGLSKSEIDQRVQRAAQILDLTPYLKRRPKALSGGQRQRVAMGRAIVREPAAFLMDEPLSNLDAKLRVQMRAEIAGVQQDLGTTTIYVTHDQVEAMTMGDRVAVMRKGELQQVATPQELYDHPVNLFVGGFIGSPAMNLVQARIVRDGEATLADMGEGQALELDPELVGQRPALARFDGREVILGGAPPRRRLRGTVTLREALGSEIMMHLTVGARPAITDETRELAEDAGTLEQAGDHPETVMVGRFSPRSTARAGDAIDVVVDTTGLHFFDPETGLGIYDHAGGART